MHFFSDASVAGFIRSGQRKRAKAKKEGTERYREQQND
jgi:hypothetical protein